MMKRPAKDNTIDALAFAFALSRCGREKSESLGWRAEGTRAGLVIQLLPDKTSFLIGRSLTFCMRSLPTMENGAKSTMASIPDQV